MTSPFRPMAGLRLFYVLFAGVAAWVLVHEYRHGERAQSLVMRELSQASFREDVGGYDAAIETLSRVSPERGELERARAMVTGRMGVEKDAAEGHRRLESLGEQESDIRPKALYERGRLLIVEQDPARIGLGVDLLERAAADGERLAAAVLGDLYAQGKRVPRDLPRAASHYQNAASTVPEAALALARLYESGELTAPNSRAQQDQVDQALRLFEQHARAGHLSSMVKLGAYHEHALEFAPQPEVPAVAVARVDEDAEPEQQDDEEAAVKPADAGSVQTASRELELARYWYEQAVAEDSDAARVRLALLLRHHDRSPAARGEAVRLLKRAADNGSGRALIELAKCYRDGVDGPADPVKAFQTNQRAAELKLPGGVLAVGVAYMAGAGVKQNFETGFEWLHRAVAMGSSSAKFQIGLAHRRGSGVPQSDAEAVRWYKDAAESGNAAGMAAYARALARARGVAADPVAALKWADRAVSGGMRTPDLLTMVGRAYAQGDGMPQDIDKAQRYLELAARQDDSDAMILLGRLLALNRRAPPEVTISWFRRAELSGYPNALAALGRAYASGFGVPLDEHKAFEYFHRASHLGSASAMREVGHAYAIGFGVQKSPAVAIDWFLKAAALGDTKAMLALSFCYASGTAVTASATQAVNWLRKAADTGNASAQYRLGVAYQSGVDVPRNMAQARHYFQEAASRDFQPAVRALKALDGPTQAEPLKTARAETEDPIEEEMP